MVKILTPENYELIPLNDMTNVRFYTSVDSGSYVAPHWHDAIEIVYMQDGELKFIIENMVHEIKSGQCIMVSPNKIHSTLCTKPNRAIVFQIPESFLEKFIPNSKQLDFMLTDPAPTPVLQGKVELFKETLFKMQILVDMNPDGAILRFNSLLFEVLFQLYHNFSNAVFKANVTNRDRNMDKLKCVLNYTAENYNRPIPLDEIASVAMFEPKYFCRFFKKCMGVTFLEYQNEVKLSKIYNDVLSTNDKISEILERHGFTNYKLFRKMFADYFGSTPNALRKSMKI